MSWLALWIMLALWLGFVPVRDAGLEYVEDPMALLCPEHPVPFFATARAQLDHARGMKLRRRGADERMARYWGRRAVDAYRAVPKRFPDQVQLCQEAWFRSARLLAVMGREVESRHDFFKAAEDATSFGFRARMEIAHGRRNHGLWGDALDIYFSVARDRLAPPDQRANAWLFAGDMYARMGMINDAERAWSAVIMGTYDGRKRVLAFDRLAEVVEDCDQPERVAELFFACLNQLGELILEESSDGARVRRALLRSRLVKMLAGVNESMPASMK